MRNYNVDFSPYRDDYEKIKNRIKKIKPTLPCCFAYCFIFRRETECNELTCLTLKREIKMKAYFEIIL